MPTTALHDEVAKLAGDKGALILSSEMVTGLIARHFEAANNALLGNSVPAAPDVTIVEARFDQLQTNSGNPLDFKIIEKGNDFFIISDQGFSLSITLHVQGDPNLAFSILIIDVSEISIAITAGSGAIIMGAPDFTASGRVDDTVSTRQAALNASGISLDTLLRIEGSLAFMMAHRIVASALGKIRTILLKDLFPGVQLNGTITLASVLNSIILIPAEGLSVTGPSGCPDTDTAPDLQLGYQPTGATEWDFQKINVPALKQYNISSPADGVAAVYLPRQILEKDFGKVQPGAIYRDRSDTFIGWELEFTASLRKIGVDIDPARFGVVIRFTIECSGYAALNVDVPCVGRMDLATARLTMDPSQLDILLRFAVIDEGQLVLRSEIDRLDMGTARVSVSAFSKWLSAAGGYAAAMAVITDIIIGKVLAHNVPLKIRDAIKKELNFRNLLAIDITPYISFFTQFINFRAATFSGDQNSIVIGITNVPGFLREET
jgi:hypothetical protein